MKKIVLTGGTYCGKTTIVNRLEDEGFLVVPDVGLEIIKELNQEIGVEKQKEWRKNNPEKFYKKIIIRQFEVEEHIVTKDDDIVFLDRGVYDYVAFMQLVGCEISSELIEKMKYVQYDYIFLLDSLADFDTREETGRSLKKEDSEKLACLIKEIYETHGYAMTHVPCTSIEERVKIIKRVIPSEVSAQGGCALGAEGSIGEVKYS